MKREAMMDILKKFGINSREDYIHQAFSRNIGLLTLEEQKKLSTARVAIPGMGGVGGVHLITLARTGIGKFNIADFDVFEPPNINRQFGARIPDLGRKKLEVMKEQALFVNPYLEINLFEDGIHEKNMDAFLDGVDVVVDGLDFFQFEVRRALFKRAAEKGIYVITAGPMGFSSAMLVFDPKGMGFDEYFNVTDGMSDKDKYLSFALGLSPRPTHIKYMNLKKVDLDSKAGPSLNIACQLCSGMATTEVIRIILNKKGIRPVPCYIQFDPYVMKLKKGKLLLGNKNPVQRVKIKAVKFLIEKNKKNRLPQISIPASDGVQPGHIPIEIINYIVTMGTWAPSADNCQPWMFSWDGHTLSLIKDPERSGFFYDVNQESTYITFGALIENISIAASHFGLQAEINLFPKGYNSDVITDLRFELKNVEEDFLFPYILSRCVNRAYYDRKQIGSEIIKTLKKTVSQTSEAELIWIDNEKDKKIFQKIVFDADRVLFEEPKLHKCLFRWINLNNNQKKDGMDLDVLGMNFIQRLIFPLMADWKRMQLMNKFGASRMAGINSVKLLKSSSAYGLIAIKNRSPESYINGGRALERFWVKANSLGLSLQPMAGFVFLLNHFIADGAHRFRSEHQQLIQNFQNNLNQIKGLERGLNCLMFFRIGLCDKRTKRTNRKAPIFSRQSNN